MVAASELAIDTNASAIAMANAIFGDGVTVTGASYTGSGYSSGIYTGGLSTSPGVVPGDSGVILSTGRARDFTNSSGEANQSTNTSTNSAGPNNNAQFNAVAGARTYDASWLDVDFVADNNASVMTMQFVFSSEEYPEYTNSIYNDMVAVWINGTYVPMEVGDANVGGVNDTDNANLYVDNTNDDYNTEMDGFTLTMTLTIPLQQGVNSLRIGIADVGDSSYDSNLLIAGNSVQTVLVANSDDTFIDAGASKTMDLLANDFNDTGGTLTITHINGQAVVVDPLNPGAASVTLSTGETVTLNADGTVTVQNDAQVDDINFTYTVESSTGQTDVGFVTLNSIPCFVAGTRILTEEGLKPVETLAEGDLIVTLDDGPQPLRWIGRRVVPATGDFAPIRISQGALGEHNDLLVSPQHRVLIQDMFAELLFGEPEVLVAAKHLVNDLSIRREEGGEVEYVHLLFDKHQVIYSEGLATESFLPGPQTTGSFEEELVDEICSIFPEIDPDTGQGYSPAVRRTLKAHEAEVLIAGSEAA